MKLIPAHALRSVLTGMTMLLLALHSAHADIYVIVNPGTKLTADDIRYVYTGEMDLAGSTKIRAYDNGMAKGEFLSKVLQIDAVKYDSLWTKKSFRDGATPPTLKNTDDDVIAAVKSTPGAVGYISSAPPAGVTLVKKF
jgi:ABC-type phosphate transport system substrate-binding protein